jgi:hypothetical protein
LLSATVLCAATPQQIIPLSNPLYDDVDTLYLLTGLPSASWSRPWTVTEARMIMDRLPAILTPEAERIRDRVMQTLDEQPKWKLDDSTSLSLHLDANLEGYFHTNTEDYTSYLDWNYSYTDRQPMLRARLDASFFDHVYLGMEAQYGYGLTARQSYDPQNGEDAAFIRSKNANRRRSMFQVLVLHNRKYGFSRNHYSKLSWFAAFPCTSICSSQM